MTSLTAEERARLEAIRSAGSLSELERVTGTNDPHAAYFEAKSEWSELRARELPTGPMEGGLPGTSVAVGGTEFHVHGITHADTAAEGEFLRGHVSRFVEAGADVYCEQGIRGMYFDDFPEVCGMDDYRWAMRRCEELGVDSHASEVRGTEFEGVMEEVDSLAARFREAAFSLIHSDRGRYDGAFESALGDVASDFLVSHEEMATGDDFEAFVRTRAAAEDPERLPELQRYYERTFLPQPLEREWLGRHDRELEIVTHARNERMADYARYHNRDADEVHLVVGAAHQPGVRYYLERYRDGERRLEGFEPMG